MTDRPNQHESPPTRTWRDRRDQVVGVVRKETLALDVRLLVGAGLARLVPPLAGNRLRTALLRLGGLSIGAGTAFGGPTTVVGYFGAKGLTIGRDCIVNGRSHFDVTERIEVGDRVALGQDVMVITGSHEIGDARRRWGSMTQAPVTIGSGAWIGARTVILPGVCIGEGAVVATGAVVARDVEPHTLVGGVPAKMIRRLDAPD